MFIKFPKFNLPHDLFILSTSKSPEINVNKTLICKVNLHKFGPHAFDYATEPQLMSKNAF